MRGHQVVPLCVLLGVLFGGLLPNLEAQEVLAVGKRDIIFLIDSTMGATIINSVREFIKRFVEIMPIGQDQVQVGVAQFGNAPRLDIDLNSYGSREELTAALSSIKPKPGQTVNIGAALDFVRTNMLRPEKGSRMNQGIPQVLLLLTSKKSSDSVVGPALALQRLGVLTLAAGSKTAEVPELQQIAFADSVAFYMRDFRQLIRNPKAIVDALSTLAGVVVTEQPTEPVVVITTVRTQIVVRDIVFLVDGSTYIGSSNFPFMRDFIINVVNQLDIGPERVQIGLLQFADHPKMEFYLNSHSDRQEIVDKISQLRLSGGSVLNTGAAMNYALDNMFRVSTGSRRKQGVQQVLVLITGGPAQDQVKSVADKLALAGILTFTVSSGQADEALMRNVAFVPDLAYHETSFTSLPALAESIMPKLITVVGDTDTVTSVFPDEPAAGGERDVAFLIDGTESVRGDFEYIRDFIIKVIEPLDIGIDKVRVSVVQHSERPTPTFYLNTYQTKDDVIRAVNGMTLTGGRTLNTGTALRFMKDTILSERHGSRSLQNVPQFLIVLTGGRSRDNVKDPAGALKTDGVVPFGVGVRDADPRQIAAISHNPSFAFNLREFSELSTVPQKLNNYVSLPRDELTLVLQQVQSNAAKRDIVFLLDGSDNTRNGFPEIKLFVKSIVESLSVSESHDRVSVVQFADNPDVNFYLNSHKTKNDMLNAIDKLRHKGGRRLNIGGALQFVRHSVFTSSTGSRRLEGVPQILIVLIAKPSSDNVRSSAYALKEHDIVSVGVGVGDANLSELEMIAYKPGFTYKVTDFSELPSAQSQLAAILNITKETEETMTGITDLLGSNKRDLVFLLDGSDESRNGLPAIREFIRRMMEDLDIAEDKIRVSVVQYSNDNTVYFNLKTHRSKKAIIHAVRSLRHKGGRPRNTGNALQFVRDHVFTPSSGSRRLEGVPQILVVLTGGKSNDDVSQAALDLKQIGVLSFAIGMKNTKLEELQRIAFSSRFLFNLPVFGELLSIQPEISAFVKAEIQIEPPTVIVELESPQRDIVFLIDGSDDTRNGFPAMKSFVQQVVETLSVGENKDRVSVVQYSRDPQTHFSLNTYNEKQNLLAAVQQLNHKGGGPLNTGAALDYVRKNGFADSSGSRHQDGVPQILILLSGGRSQDDVAIAAAALKQDKVVAFCEASHAFFAADSIHLSGIEQQLFSEIMNNETPAIKHTLYDPNRRDVVFLLDGSDDSQQRFPDIKEFVQRIVADLNIDANRDHVAVLQYSNEARIDFDFRRYSTQDDVLDAVRGLSHKGGSPHNIGAALQYVKDHVFTPELGSRLLEGVPQILILLSGGRSEDDIRTPVRMLKNTGVITIAIGTTNADTLQLQTISHEPNYAISITDYEELQTAKQDVLSLLRDASQRPEQTTSPKAFDSEKKDVVFLIDGSHDSRNSFEEIRGFVEKMVEGLNLDENRDQVAIVQFSRDATANFYLNSYSTKNDVLNSIRTIRHKEFVKQTEIGPSKVQVALIQYSTEPTSEFFLNTHSLKDDVIGHLSNVKLKGGLSVNTGLALEYVKNNVFSASSGSRAQQGVPQILILFSGRKSEDDVLGPVERMRKTGIVIFSVGMIDAERLEMEQIAHSPKAKYLIKDISDFPLVRDQLLSDIASHKDSDSPGVGE
ncbi:collagen alpha-3(VI) chain-like [Pseudochaenichthys georgianus]|uniref:collagen alpha-3(VI) chain-like n=1 Tax=Pseudochaenichthys georgianus TaxID=52239 RepID=UPI0039C1E65E